MGAEIVTYSGKTVTSLDDALVYESALGAGGVIYGAEVTIQSGSVLHVAAGHVVLCGRKITIGETNVSVQLPTSGTLLGRLYLHMDLSNVMTPVELLTEVAATLTDPVQDEHVNVLNGVYEINLATFTASASSMSDLVNVAPAVAPGSPSFIAPIEPGSTSLRSYTTGQYLLYRGKLYRATTTIAQGAALVPGTNMELVVLSEELYSVDQSLNGFSFGVDGQGKAGYRLPGTTEIIPFKKASGTAEPAQVLTGYTFSNDDEQGLAGAMPDWGSVIMSPEGDEELVAPEGYYSEIIVDGSVAYAAGQDSVKTGLHTWTINTGTTVADQTWNTGLGSKLIGASVTAMSGLRFYSWQENYNAYSPGSVTCTCSGGTIRVNLPSNATRETGTGSGDRATVTITVTYWYFDD